MVIDDDRLVRSIVYKLCKKYRIYGMIEYIDQDDLIQVGHLAVIAADKTYDPAKGKRTTYLYTRILGDIRDELRKTTRHAKDPREWGIRHVSISVNVNISDDNREQDWLDRHYSTSDTPETDYERDAEEVNNRAIINDAIARLPERLQIVMKGLLAGKEKQDIAKELQVTPGRITQMMDSAMGKMRHRLATRQGLDV